MKKIILGLLLFSSFTALADQSGTYICRCIEVFYGDNIGGAFKVDVSKDFKFAKITFSDVTGWDISTAKFPSSRVIKLKKVGTKFGNLRYEGSSTIKDGDSFTTNDFSFNLMGVANFPKDILRSTDGVLTQTDSTFLKFAYLCVKR